MIKVGIIRVLTTRDEDLLNAHGRLIESHFPQLETVSRCIQDQPEGIHDEHTKQIAVPKVVRLGREMEAEGVKALIISCADDPGLDELRKNVKIPVIGAGSAAASLALSLGRRIGVLTLTEGTPEPVKKILGNSFLADIKTEGVMTTLDLLDEKRKTQLISSARELKAKGADVILLSCTGYATIGIAQELKQSLGIPIVDPVLASAMATWYATSALTQS
ncbi:AroM family protein [Candidatus Bathyarchaeota archaeon]|nr:AroM family protein [Candidatus Bathyarchaeota archaeon]